MKPVSMIILAGVLLGAGCKTSRLATDPGALPPFIRPTTEEVDPSAVAAMGKDAPVVKAARVWGLVVGVSRYELSELSLQFARADALSVAAFLRSPAAGSVPDERLVVLVDEQATRAAVLSKLVEIAGKASEDDLLFIYIAMHGLPDELGELYYLTHDTDPAALVGTGLPQRDIEYALGRSKAKKIVMFIDACHSGGAGLTDFARRGLRFSETNRLLSGMADAIDGTAIISASSANESSLEGEKWDGHGAFTFHLVAGLSGAADGDGNGFVELRELYEYVEQRVSQDTGGKQHPDINGKYDGKLPLADVGTGEQP